MDPEHSPGPDYPLRERIPARVRPEELMVGYRAAASVLRSLVNHVGELDSCDLPLPDGKVVRVVTVSEVESWINAAALRVANGETL